MNKSEFWLLKISALLHDPPNKALNISGHEKQAQAWAQILNITLENNDFKQADWIASAADRLNFPNYQSIDGADFRKQPYLTHPLTGEGIDLSKDHFLPTKIDENQLQQAIRNSLEFIPPEIKQDPKKLFLWLWRNWSAQIQSTDANQLGVLWDLLPADTRIPDHSIWAHQALTSAIAATNSKPAFLLFTIGPVQAFISAARPTQDLWVGSYLLSYLNWTAIQVIAEEIGPDAVIFPNLIGQPLCDSWLTSKGILPESPKLEDLILPSLPNRFLAIVPTEQGEALAKKAAEEMQAKWQEISQAVRLDLEKVLGQPPAWCKTWERQTKNLFETYWQIYPWQPMGKEPIQDKNFYKFLNPHKPYLGNRFVETEKILKIYRDDTGTYAPNIGAIYSDIYFITEKVLGSRKSLRNFPQVDETGEKSILAGERAALYDGVDNLQDNQAVNFDHIPRNKIRKFWDNLAKKLQKRGRYEIQEEGKERLDAVELTKRCAWRSYFQKQPSFNCGLREQKLPFPSTYSVASASFKEAILNELLKPDTESLRQSLEKWVNIVYPISQGNLVDRNVIPALAAKVNSSNHLLNKFLSLDGRLLYEETYLDPSEFSDNIEKNQIEIAQQKLKDFIKTAKEHNIPKPRKYFAVLMMDGDEMGKWISGDKMPEYQSVLHPTTKTALADRGDWHSILETKRLMSPAIHGFISKALGDFSLKLVRHIVETRHPGKLVYAGGDDVLALLPLNSALEVARELRAAFSGEIFTGEASTDDAGTKFDVQFGKQKSGYLWLEMIKGDTNSRRLFTTMGHKATASTGIAIAHYKQALDITLAEVRKAEKAAKSQEGRNAFSLTFLKRSGEIMSAGAKWNYADKSIDTVDILLEFQNKFADDSISGKFPYALREQAEIFSQLEIPKLYESEIKRLLLRQQGNKNISKEERQELANTLAEKLSSLIIQANQETTKDEHTKKIPGKFKTFADLLIFTRFLATGEGEE